MTDFVWSPNSGFVAYRANQDNVINFRTVCDTPDDSSNDPKFPATRLRGMSTLFFEWSPDSKESLIGRIRGRQMPSSSLPLRRMVRRMTGSPVIVSASGGNVEEFIWAPDGSGIGYIADQENGGIFKLNLDPHRMAMKRPRFPVRLLMPVMFCFLNRYPDFLPQLDQTQLSARHSVLGIRYWHRSICFQI